MAAAVLVSLPAWAADVSFFGTLSRSNPPPGPGGRCAPALTIINDNVGSNSSTGLSNLGAFLNTASACLIPPLPTTTYDGVWLFDFAGGDSLYGTGSSEVGLTATPGVFSIHGYFAVTGGSGSMLNATGAFEEFGTLDRRGAMALADGEFRGMLNLPAVPEPSNWALLLGGLVAVGAAARRRSDRL